MDWTVHLESISTFITINSNWSGLESIGIQWSPVESSGVHWTSGINTCLLNITKKKKPRTRIEPRTY
jgi:hypothetical protein